LRGKKLGGCAGPEREKEKEKALEAFNRLEAPSTLKTTCLKTNLTENLIRSWRAVRHQMKRCQIKDDMLDRWMASGLLWAESRFRQIRQAEDLPAP